MKQMPFQLAGIFAGCRQALFLIKGYEIAGHPHHGFP